jgi:hypothetical protein
MSISVGDHELVIGDVAGTVIQRAEAPAGGARHLAEALRSSPPEQPRTERVVGGAEDYTDRLEKGAELAEQLERGFTPADLEEWIGPTLDLIERLDRSGRSKKTLELVRMAQRVLALARRWLELIKLLRGVLEAARAAGDDATVAWAQHELGTLHLAAGQLREADAALSESLSLRRRIADADGVAATERNLRTLCCQLREELHRRPNQARRLPRPVLVAIALMLLLTGAVAHAVIRPDPGTAKTSAVLRAGVDGRGSVTGGGIDCPGTCSRVVPIGGRVTLVPSPGQRSTFAGWSGDCSGTSVCTVRLDADRDVTAHFKLAKATRTLRARIDGDGRVTSRPAGIDCPSTCSTRVERGRTVQLRATALANATFAGWKGGGCSGTGVCTVDVTESTTVTARFAGDATPRKLTVERTGDGAGTVTSDRGGIDCGTQCDATLPDGTKVTLRARAGEGSEFAGWSGGACADDASCTVTLNSSATVTARFTKGTSPPITLTVNPAGDGTGAVLSDPPAIDCGSRCTETYDAGAQVTLRASAHEGSDFDGWSGGNCSGNKLCTVTMDQSKSVTATFSKTPTARFSLTTTTDGDGTIRADPSCTGSPCAYDAGTTVTLTATPGDGSDFTEWRGCPSADGASCTVQMDAGHSIGAVFAERSDNPIE